MYWVTPFHYLLEAAVGLVTHGVPVTCATQELAMFSPPPGSTCDEYAGPYAQKAGGYVQTMENGMCGFCQYANGDQFVSCRHEEADSDADQCRLRVSTSTMPMYGATMAYFGDISSLILLLSLFARIYI
jgi:hypothetical protein